MSYKKANLLALDYGNAAPLGSNKTGCTNKAGIRIWVDRCATKEVNHCKIDTNHTAQSDYKPGNKTCRHRRQGALELPEGRPARHRLPKP
jgi:hypothetical protein